MLIQLFTESIPIDNGFNLKQYLYFNFNNVGNIVDGDKPFGLTKREFNYIDVFHGKKQAYSNDKWLVYKGTNIKRYAIVYTDNENVWDNVNLSIRDTQHSVLLTRIREMLTEYGVKLVVDKKESLQDKNHIEWLKRKYEC